MQKLINYLFSKSSTNNDQNQVVSDDQQQQQHRTTEENIVIVQNIFKRFKDTVDKYEKEVLRDFETLTQDQQDQVVSQYEEATAFICDLFDWLDKVFDYAVQRVQAGYTIERNGIRILFERVRVELNQLFQQQDTVTTTTANTDSHESTASEQPTSSLSCEEPTKDSQQQSQTKSCSKL